MAKITPVSFVKVNSRLEVFFTNDGNGNDTWFAGKVTKVIERADDYIICDIVYDDGEKFEHVKLENEHFERESDESWRFEGDLSKLIKVVVDTNNDVEDLKSDVECMQEELVDMMCESEDEDDSEIESSEDEEDDDTAFESESSNEEPVKYERDYTGLKWYLYGITLGTMFGMVLGTYPQINQYTCPTLSSLF